MALLEQGEYTEYLGMVEDFSVGDLISLLDIQDVSWITKVEDIETLLPSGLEAPYLTALVH